MIKTFGIRFTVPLLALACMPGAAPAQPVATEIPALRAESRDDNWWMPRHQQKLEELRAADRVDVVMIGDSITHGWENAGKALWDEFYAPRHALNLGYSGDRTEHVLWRLRNGEVDGISPKLAVIMIGTNNTGHRKDPAEESAAGIQAILTELRTRLPAMKILLLAVFPRDAQPDGELRVINDELNRRLKELADGEKVNFLDINHVFLNEDGSLPRDIMPDFLHPNATGYRKWAEAMEPTIRTLLGEKYPPPR
jgi:beta-glucosidase